MLIAEQAIVQFQNFIASQVAKHGGVYVAYVLGKARTGTVVIRAGFEEIRAIGDFGNSSGQPHKRAHCLKELWEYAF